jgi:hypothetical protein
MQVVAENPIQRSIFRLTRTPDSSAAVAGASIAIITTQPGMMQYHMRATKG